MRFQSTTYMPVFVGTCEEYEKVVLYTSPDRPGELFLSCDGGDLQSLERGAEVHLRLDPVLEIQHLCVESEVWSGEAVGNKYGLIDEGPLVVPE
jgi:hypothetical protein